jgi:dTDP-4-amino-4,6-dideoxygalactose transaminase
LPAWSAEHIWHLFVVRTEPERRNDLIDHLLARGISAGVHYKPLTLYPMYDQDTPPVTEREWQRLISLPIYYDLTFEQVKYISRKLREIVTHTIAS